MLLRGHLSLSENHFSRSEGLFSRVHGQKSIELETVVSNTGVGKQQNVI
jgi:hypothetical protein